MLKTIAIILAVAVAAILVSAGFQPDTFRVQRATSIDAPPEKVFALISDFHRWGSWSPYEKMDPGMKRTYSGADSGQGAVYEWQGNSKVGQGRMEILEAPAPSSSTCPRRRSRTPPSSPRFRWASRPSRSSASTDR